MTLPNITPPNRSAITAAILAQKQQKDTTNSSNKTTELAAKSYRIDTAGPVQF